MLYIVLWRSSPARGWVTVGQTFDSFAAAEEICDAFRHKGYRARIIKCLESELDAPWIDEAEVSAA